MSAKSHTRRSSQNFAWKLRPFRNLFLKAPRFSKPGRRGEAFAHISCRLVAESCAQMLRPYKNGILPILLAIAAAIALLLGSHHRVQSYETVTVSLTPIDFSEPEIVNPMRGFYKWIYQERTDDKWTNNDNVPLPKPELDAYTRYSWRQIEKAKDEYDFSVIDSDLARAEREGRKFGFRILSVNEFSSQYEVPDYLVSLVPGKDCPVSAPPEGSDTVWTPDWNDPNYIDRAGKLIQKLAQRYDGDPRIAWIDMGLYGRWGEWHNGGLCVPAGTTATKNAIIDAHLDAFKKTRLVLSVNAAQDDAEDRGDSLGYALSKSPTLGLRSDALGHVWFDEQWDILPVFVAPGTAKMMQERWKRAPLITEYFGNSIPWVALEQVKKWHVALVGNSEGAGKWSELSQYEKDVLASVGKHAGYRYLVNQVSYPPKVAAGTSISIASQWYNLGVAPTYDRWNITFALHKNGINAPLWKKTSSLDLKTLLPAQEPATVRESWCVPKWMPAGIYDLSLTIVDPVGYNPPLQLAVKEMDEEGRLFLGKVQVLDRAGDC